MLDVNIDDKQYLLVNVYGMKTIHNFTNIQGKNETVSNNHYIIRNGDFNMMMEKNYHTINYKSLNNPKARSELIKWNP